MNIDKELEEKLTRRLVLNGEATSENLTKIHAKTPDQDKSGATKKKSVTGNYNEGGLDNEGGKWGALSKEFSKRRPSAWMVRTPELGIKEVTLIHSGIDFDDNGLLYFLGTSGKAQSYCNPHTAGIVVASMKHVHKGTPANIVEHTNNGYPNYSKNGRRAWVMIDIGKNRKFLPNHYSLRHGSAGVGNALRTWQLQARLFDCDPWITLRDHVNDTSLAEQPGSTANWPIVVDNSDISGYRYFRVIQLKRNSGGNNCLFCSGIELWGRLTQQDEVL